MKKLLTAIAASAVIMVTAQAGRLYIVSNNGDWRTAINTDYIVSVKSHGEKIIIDTTKKTFVYKCLDDNFRKRFFAAIDQSLIHSNTDITIDLNDIHEDSPACNQ